MYRIELLRKEIGMNQAELAKYLNLSQQTISKYESGKADPSKKTLIELSKLFNVSVDYIIGNSKRRKYSESQCVTNSNAEKSTDFGARLKKARQSNNLKQTDLGKLIGVSGQAISNLERGYTNTITPQMINKLSVALNVSVSYFTHNDSLDSNSSLDMYENYDISSILNELQFQLNHVPKNALNYEGIKINKEDIKLLTGILDLIVEHIKGTKN